MVKREKLKLMVACTAVNHIVVKIRTKDAHSDSHSVYVYSHWSIRSNATTQR